MLFSTKSINTFHVRLLFADSSPAFNKMQPHIVIERLASLLNLPDFIVCDTLVLNTGSPQSWVFLPLPFIL